MYYYAAPVSKMAGVSCTLRVLILTLTAARVSGQPVGWFTQTPHDAALLEGDSVVLHCQVDIRRIVEHGEYMVTWSKNQTQLNFADPEHSHLWLTGDPHSAQYYLLIAGADVDDSGVFSCAVFENNATASGGEDAWVAHAVATAEVRVFVRPPPPECRKTDLDVPANWTHPDVNYEGDRIELICTGYFSHPSFALEMTWKERVITEDDGAWVHIDEDQVQELAYRITADYQDNGASFRCTLTSSEFPDYRETCEMIALNILHEPKLDFVSDKSEVRQGESLIVACLSVSNPSQVFFGWYTEPAQTVSYLAGGQVLQIPAVFSDTGLLNITCVVTNDHGMSVLSRLVPVLSNTTQPEATTPPGPVAHTTLHASTQAPPTAAAPTSQPGVEPGTKPDKTTAATPGKEPATTKTPPDAHGTALIAVLAVVPVIIVAISVVVVVFLYKTVKLSTKRRDDEIRVVYSDRRTHGGNSNVTVTPTALNGGAVVPTDGVEPGAYSVPPPYTKGELLPIGASEFESDAAASGGHDDPPCVDEKTDNHMYVNMKF